MNCSIGCSPRKSCTVTRVTTATPSARRSALENCFSPWLYRHRNAIERMFGRLKDFRRVATRYDRLARNFLATVCLAATLCYWL
jgi:transposase